MFRNVGGGMSRDLPPFRCPIGDQQQVAYLGNLEGGTLDAGFVDRLRRIQQAMKVKPPAGAQISADLVGELLLAYDPLTVTRRRKSHHAIVPQWRSRIDCEGLPKLVKLENPLAEMRNGDG